MLASIFIKRPARDFSAFARVSNQSEISSKPSSRTVFAIPGYMSVNSWLSPAKAAFKFSSVLLLCNDIFVSPKIQMCKLTLGRQDAAQVTTYDQIKFNNNDLFRSA